MISSIRQQALCLYLIVVVDTISLNTYTLADFLCLCIRRQDNTTNGISRSFLQRSLESNSGSCQIFNFTSDSLGIGQDCTGDRTRISNVTLQGNESLIVNHLTRSTRDRRTELRGTFAGYLLRKIVLGITIHESYSVRSGRLTFESLHRTMEDSRRGCNVSRPRNNGIFIQQWGCARRIVIVRASCEEDAHDKCHYSK